jgi:hypothetical protein
VDPTLEGLWKQVLDAWDDDVLHGKLISYAQTADCLGQAAALYKSVAHTADSPYRLSPAQVQDAKKRLNGITMLAVMTLEAGKSEPGPPKGLFWVRAIAAVLFIATAILVVLILQKQ